MPLGRPARQPATGGQPTGRCCTPPVQGGLAATSARVFVYLGLASRQAYKPRVDTTLESTHSSATPNTPSAGQLPVMHLVFGRLPPSPCSPVPPPCRQSYGISHSLCPFFTPPVQPFLASSITKPPLRSCRALHLSRPNDDVCCSSHTAATCSPDYPQLDVLPPGRLPSVPLCTPAFGPSCPHSTCC